MENGRTLFDIFYSHRHWYIFDYDKEAEVYGKNLIEMEECAYKYVDDIRGAGDRWKRIIQNEVQRLLSPNPYPFFLKDEAKEWHKLAVSDFLLYVKTALEHYGFYVLELPEKYHRLFGTIKNCFNNDQVLLADEVNWTLIKKRREERLLKKRREERLDKCILNRELKDNAERSLQDEEADYTLPKWKKDILNEYIPNSESQEKFIKDILKVQSRKQVLNIIYKAWKNDEISFIPVKDYNLIFPIHIATETYNRKFRERRRRLKET